MQKKRLLFRLMLVLMVALLVTACGGGSQPASSDPDPTDPPPTEAPTDEPVDAQAEEPTAEEVAQEPTDEPTDAPTEVPPTDVPPTEVPTEVPPTATLVPVASDGADGKILAWVAPAAAPGRQASDEPGQLVYFSPNGAMEVLLDLPESITRVTACGDASTSPDGSIFAFITTVSAGGGESASLHLIRGASSDIETVAEDLNPMACSGSSNFHFSPDGARFGFIDWPEDANNAGSPIGRMLIYNASDASQEANIENVTDFTLTNDGAAFVSFFLDGDGDATEVAVSTWDGNNDREVATLRSEENCAYTSASIARMSGSQLAVILGNRCSGQSTQWQLQIVDTEATSAQLEASDATGGRYFPYSDTNATWASPDGDTLWFTVPDGVSNQSVSLYSTPIDSISATQVIERFALMPTISDLPYDANNATAVLSPNGQYLAIVRKDGNDDAVLYVVNLAEPSLDPVQFDAGDRGDTIAVMKFSQDSSELVFVAGTDEGGNNALLTMDLATGNENRISRGRYAQIAISPDASRIAAMSWNVWDDDEDPYLQLVVFDVEASGETVIFEGGEIDGEGNLINQQFAYPLSWRTP